MLLWDVVTSTATASSGDGRYTTIRVFHFFRLAFKETDAGSSPTRTFDCTLRDALSGDEKEKKPPIVKAQEKAMKLRSNYRKVWQKAAHIQPYAAKMPFKFAKIRQKIQNKENLASNHRLLPCGCVPLPSVLEWGDLRFNSATLEATYADRLLDLTAKECRLLEMFLHNGRRVLNQSEILESLWHKEEKPSADSW